MLSWLLAAALALSAPTPVEAPEPLAPAQVAEMPPALQQQVRDRILVGRPSERARLERLISFMFDPQGLGMTYDEDATYSVAEAYAVRKANCLTFTLLFLALAREAGLDAYPQEIGETLAWHLDERTLYRNSHVNAGVRVPTGQFVVDVTGDSIIARDQPVPISGERLLAHYYNNLAIQRLAQGQLDSARQLIDMALQQDPTYATHWSNAGVIHLRSGDTAAAEAAYARALQLDPANTGALFNMVGLTHRNGDPREAEFRRRLARVQQRDPFHHFLQAVDYERNQDYAQAIRHYRRAIQLHPGEHRFHYALSRAYLRAGQTRKAVKSLVRAQGLSDGATRAAYRAELEQLRQASN